MFDSLLKDLLQGKFICEISDAPAFRYLQEFDNVQQVEEFLNRLGYRDSESIQNQRYLREKKH